MANVKFLSVKLKSTFDALETKDSLALYWIEETQELFKGDKLYGTGAVVTDEFAGLMSPKDKATLDALVEADDVLIDTIQNVYEVRKYEISHKPVGTLVDYRDKEIRVMCPKDTKWVKQDVGNSGNSNMYYMGFKAYAPEGAVGFKEGGRGVIIDEYFDFSGDFAGTDEYGRNYSICWFALASYDAGSDTWTYFGKNSSAEKYIGWDYIVEWYDADGVVISSDCIRINLSNEDCHYSAKPYYVGGMMKDVESIVEEKVADVESAYEIFEF